MRTSPCSAGLLKDVQVAGVQEIERAVQRDDCVLSP